MTEAYLGLGTNLGDREAYLARALDLLAETEGVKIGKISRVYRSAPWGITDQPEFLNICVQISTWLNPEELLRACKQVEMLIGRTRTERWGPREIDVDVLLIDGVDFDTPNLTIPHRRLVERRFVLEPLSEIAPDWVIDGMAVTDLARYLRADVPDQMCEPDEKATQRVSQLRGSAVVE